MRQRAVLVFALALALGGIARGAPEATERLPTDPSLFTGELANGLRFVVRRHAQPAGRAVVWMHVHAGSLNETDRQRGVAHYLEHMAFNGSENFPPGTLVPFFESMGLTFGRDQNAFTNLEQTTYQLSLPDAKAETLGKAMTYFADVLTRLLLAEKEIEAERQVILEEWRRGLSGRRRVEDLLRERLAPGSLYARRDTIGTEASIRALTPQDFRDFYGAWYAASNATVLVLADADPSDVVAAVRAGFDGAPKRPRPAAVAPGVAGYGASFAVVASDPEVDAEEVRIVRQGPAQPPVETLPQWREDLALDLAVAAFNRRLEDRVARGGTNLLRAQAEAGNAGRLLHAWEVSGRPAPGRWEGAVEDLALALQRARRHGFTDREVEVAKRARLAQAEQEAETEATTPARALMWRLNAWVGSGGTHPSAAQRLDLARRVLASVTREEVGRRFAEVFDPSAVAFVAVLPAGPAVPTEARLLEVGTKALAVEPAAEAEAPRATRLIDAAPTPGAVKEGEAHAATGVWTGWLSNGVAVHQRSMDAQRNEVSVEISLVGGEVLETAETRGATAAALTAWRTPATRRLSSGDIRDLMAGKKVSVSAGAGGRRRGHPGGREGPGGVGGGSIALTVAGSPDDLEAGLQLAYLLLTEPKVEAAAFERWRTTTAEGIGEAARNAVGVGMRLAGSAPFPDGDPRLQPLEQAQVARLTAAAAQAWLDRLVRTSPVEVAVVGDMPRERVLGLVARWVGALPERARSGTGTLRAQRTLERPRGPRRLERVVDTPTRQAFVASGFWGPDEAARDDVRALALAAQILTTRLTVEVREKEQLVYSIGAASRPGVVYPGFGVFAAASPTEPEKADALAAKLASMYDAFAAAGPTEEEMAVARRQAANAASAQQKDPGWWAGRLSLLRFRGGSLDDLAADAAATQALTAAQVKDAFARHWGEASSIVVVARPR